MGCVRLGDAVGGMAPDHYEHRRGHPADARVAVLKAAGAQLHDRHLARVRGAHASEVAQQSADGAASGWRRGHEGEQLQRAGVLQDEVIGVQPRIVGLRH